jgi:uncharacterized sporulation protein YeaH/YhbH (DUF444 family)
MTLYKTMSNMENEALTLPNPNGKTETRTVNIDPEALAKMVDNGGAEFCLNIIRELEDSQENEWLVRKAEQRMLEVLAERLEVLNTSERAVEWFRDYHDLNGEAEGYE